MDRRLVGVAATVVLVGLAWWLVPGAQSPSTSSSHSSDRARPLPPIERELSRPPRAALPAAPAEFAEEPVEEAVLADAYALLDPESGRIRCAVSGHVPDGTYDAPPASEVLVQGGWLTALVPTPEGGARLEADLEPLAQLSWSGATRGAWGSCLLAQPEWVKVQGHVFDAAGAPAAGQEVRGCVHGSFAVTDDSGAFSLEATAGSVCHPMAFVEREDGAFGKSTAPEVKVQPPGPVTGVEIELPADDALWDSARQRQLAERLVSMHDQRLAAGDQRVDTLREAYANTDDPATRLVLVELIAHHEARLEWVDGEADRLVDPDEQLAALRDAWLNLY